MGGRILSTCGTWVQNVAAAVLMYDLTDSAFMVGAVSVAQFTGPLVFALWAGTLTDRLNRRRLLMAGRLLSSGAVGSLALVLALRGVDGFGGAPTLLVTMFVLGIGVSLSGPATQALVPALVAEEDLEPALALSSVAPGTARALGPALGALLLLLGGPALAFAVAAACHVAFVGVLLSIRGRPRKPPPERPRVLGGLHYLIADRNAGMMLLGVALLAFGTDPVVTLTPSLAARLGGGSETVGVFASAFGIGAVLLVVLFGRVRRLVTLRRAGIFGFWAVAAGIVATAASTTIPTAAAGFLIAGAGFAMATVALNTRIQRRVPDELRGRVMALWAVAFLGSRPVAAAVNGSLADVLGLQAAMLAAAVVVAGASLFARVSYQKG